MNGQLFRKKSIERVSSPDQLNDYIRVANPGMWLVLAAIAVLLIGACIWGIIGHLDTTLQTVAIGRNGQMVLYIRDADIDSVKPGMAVSIDEAEYTISELSGKPETADENFEKYAYHVGGIQQGEWIYSATLSGPYAEGIHSARVTVESVSPMSFVVN